MASEGGKIDPMHQFMIEPIVPLNLAGYDISFTNSSLFMILVMATIWVFMLGGMKRQMVPGRWQAAVEGVNGFINDMVSTSVGPEGKKYVPLVFSLFMFILVANFMGMMPFGIVPGVHAFTVTRDSSLIHHASPCSSFRYRVTAIYISINACLCAEH